MKRIVYFLISIFVMQLQFSYAQETKLRVAVFDPSGAGVDEGIKIAVRELISSTFVNTGKYTMVERSQLNQVLKEHDITNTDLVDDSQATEIGRLAGANKVVLSVVTLAGTKNMLSIKTIDVKTATIDLQKTKIVESDNLLDVVEPLTLEMLGTDNSAKSSSTVSKKTATSGKSAKGSSNSKGGQNIVLEFEGFLHSKNPEAKIFVDNNLVGEGTFNEGFSVTFTEDARGVHQVKIEWSDFVDTKTFKINTNKQTQFTFQYVKGGFGYEFKLK